MGLWTLYVSYRELIFCCTKEFLVKMLNNAKSAYSVGLLMENISLVPPWTILPKDITGGKSTFLLQQKKPDFHTQVQVKELNFITNLGFQNPPRLRASLPPNEETTPLLKMREHLLAYSTTWNESTSGA